MAYMKRREMREAEHRNAMRPVLMQFRYDATARLWRVIFRPRGETIALPRAVHFGDGDKLRDLFQRFSSFRMSEDVAALEFGIRAGRQRVTGPRRKATEQAADAQTANPEHAGYVITMGRMAPKREWKLQAKDQEGNDISARFPLNLKRFLV